MYSSGHFDIESAQPLFIHIKKCMMFEDQLVSLNPAYSVEFDEGAYSVTKDLDYIDLSSEYGLDILVLCGRNGVGKSTLLRIFENSILPGDPEFNVVFMDKNGALLSKFNIEVHINGEPEDLRGNYMFDSIAALCANGAKHTKANSFRGGLVEVYSHNPELYDEALGKKIFDGFYVDYQTDYSSFNDLEKEVSRKLGLDSEPSNFRDIVRDHPTMHVLAWLCSFHLFDEEITTLRSKGCSNYEDIYQILADDESKSIDKEFVHIRRLVQEDNVAGEDDSRSFDKLSAKLDPNREEKIRRYYDLAEYGAVREKIRELSHRIGEWIQSRFPKIDSHSGDVFDEEIVWFRPYKRHSDGTISGMWDLSGGERLKLDMTFSLIPFLIQSDSCWFHFDDWDGELHPEWKRKFIYELLITYQSSVKAMRSVGGRSKSWNPRQTCVISTHSPFLLSDMLPQNIVLLTSDKNGKTTIRRGDNSTFAGNIGELFHTEFFMDSTIGEFATRKIEQTLKGLTKKPTREKIDAAKRLFSHVGDRLLKNLLMETVENAENRNQ